MSLFTKHPATINETWWGHFKFSFGIGIKLFVSAMLFIIHGIFPFVTIPEQLNLENMSNWLEIRNEERKIKKAAQ